MENEKIKVLGLAGSQRKSGNSHVLLKYALRGAEKEGAEVEVLDPGSLKIKACGGCLACVFKGKCIQDDDMEGFLAQILASRGLIVAAPTYLLSPAAILKRLMDRGLMLAPSFEAFDSNQQKRMAVTFSVAGNARWNPLGVEMVNQFALAFGYELMACRGVDAPGPAEVVLQDKTMEDAFTMGQNLARALKGEPIERKAAGSWQCPVCFSKTFRFQNAHKVQCAICLLEGEIKGEKGPEGLFFSAEGSADHFWSPAHRRRHLEGWIKKTREPYLANRKKIKENLKKYELF